ncbi:beta-galactosidase [Venturia canescens]|uniref:beta-galactosidase n=1 Tax=Venturia canescens TaxID=32260 RepID=UPI001C9CD28D|nr:beta-galactosidase [Venturia canescens]
MVLLLFFVVSFIGVILNSSKKMWHHYYFFLIITSTVLQVITHPEKDDSSVSSSNGFGIDYANNQFLLDGRPFRYVSGSFHYFRAPRQYWRDRLRKMKAAGLNAVSTYVEWSLHQPEVDTWQWSGEADIVEFINIAHEEDLLVLLRPGPYICAERNLGGLPPWLMSLIPDIKMRTNDTRYMQHVEVYLRELMIKMVPLLRGNGGPIIMIQIENEYGSFHSCDESYKASLYNIIKGYVETKAQLYTTDGSSVSMLRCGKVPGAYATVDFGTTGNVTSNFAIMRRIEPKGPLVNSEFYPGWLTHWEEPFQRVKTANVVRVLDEMLAVGASVNIYMFYGGTNFGFTSGANGPLNYSPQLTSYDYDAPLTEAGDPTDKYFAIRDVIRKYLPLPNVSMPIVASKGDYGPVILQPIAKLFDSIARKTLSTVSGNYRNTPTFEELGIAHHLVLYETFLPNTERNPAVLYAYTMDRGLVYLDSQLVGTTSRIHEKYTVSLKEPSGKRLQILVENQGHLNFGNVTEDWKGLLRVTLDDSPLFSWNVTGFELKDIEPLTFLNNSIVVDTGIAKTSPIFLSGNFNVSGKPLDTYLDTTGWGKGIAYVNGYNLGRYWPLAGPQMTLYVPSAYLKSGCNELVVLEQDFIPTTKRMKFQDTANIG